MASSSNALDAFASTPDMNFLLASNVNVSNFVTVKLSGQTNYRVWRAQMICLVESQRLPHILVPMDGGADMIGQYDWLVKGWIFGSVNEYVLKGLIHLERASEVWTELESLFYIESTDVDELDAPTADLKFMHESNVNVLNFVTVKLSGHTNYCIWRAQMSCLVESQKLAHILDDHSYDFPIDKGTHMIWQYDRLVKGWIFSSVNENVLKDLIHLERASEVWTELEFLFSIQSSNGDECDAPTADLKFMHASNINVSNFVTVKLSGQTNYSVWSAQMICLVESQRLKHILDDTITFPMDKGTQMIPEYDRLVKGWIFGSLSESVLRNFIHFNTARDVWDNLALFYKPSLRGNEWDAPTADLKYIQISNINVSNFVSIKLSGRSNYHTWRAQMLCLLEREKLYDIIDHREPRGMDEGMFSQYQKLVKGWIFGSMNENVLKDFVNFIGDPTNVWSELESLYAPANAKTKELMLGIESERGVPEMENTVIKKELYDAVVEGCWWKAKSILKVNKNAATEPITANRNTILHLAVERGHNYFVDELLEYLKAGKDIIETKNSRGQTALHVAAMVGNEYAAQLLVQKSNSMLVTVDYRNESPWHTAYLNKKLNVSTYLLKSVLSSDLGDSIRIDQLKEAMYAAIFTKQYDIAETLFTTYAEDEWDFNNILLAITITFPTDLGFTESFIYPCISKNTSLSPVYKYYHWRTNTAVYLAAFHNVRQKLIMKGYLQCYSNILDKCIDDILRVVKICNNKCFSWLGNISLILLGEQPTI